MTYAERLRILMQSSQRPTREDELRIMAFRAVGRRIFYAFETRGARQFEMPFIVNKMHRLGVSELPEEARVTADDLKMARAEKPLKPPASSSPADIEDYQDRLKNTNLYPNVKRKIKAFAKFSPGGNIWHWSNGQFVGDESVASIPKITDYNEIYDSVLAPNIPAARRRIHERALDAMLNPLARAKTGRDKHFTMVIGPPGAGKSTLGVPMAHRIAYNYTTINVDDTRSHLPEYEGWNSSPVHMESAYLTYGPLMYRALSRNHHLLYDATGNNARTMEETLKMARDHDYKRHLIMVHRPSHEAMAGAWERFLDNPYGAKHPDKKPSRFVDPLWSYHSIGNGPLETYQHLKTTPLLHSHILLDTNVPEGERPVIMERGHV